MKIKECVKGLLKKLNLPPYRGNNDYIDDTSDCSLCDIKLDMRNPLKGKKYVRIGKDTSVNGIFIFETEDGFVDIGERVFGGGITIICKNRVCIGDNVQMAWNVLLYDHNAHSFDYIERRKDIDVFLANKKGGHDVNRNSGKDWSVVHSEPIIIGDDVWIGANVSILSGAVIGEGAIIGAGSVVRGEIPPWTIAYGNPCKVIAANKYKPKL